MCFIHTRSFPARYVDQGGGKRKGSFAMYLEPWHADIFDFLDLRKVRNPPPPRLAPSLQSIMGWHILMAITLVSPPSHRGQNHGNELERARDLFYALWIPNLFMERVEANGTWSLFCPNEAPGLPEVYGDEFKSLYERYVWTGDPACLRVHTPHA